MIRLENIYKHYYNHSGTIKQEVLKDINLEINNGDSIAILGPSGCGKSTLLNLIGSIDQPSSGKLLFEGRDLSGLKDKELSVLRNQKIGFIFQMHHLLPQLNLLENILLPTLVVQGDKHEFTARARKLLEDVGLKDKTYQFPAQLSGGESQRAAVVRALINQPKVVLADEPTGSLDKSSAEQVGNLLVSIREAQNIALIVVTHSSELADKMKSVYHLEDGKLEQIK